MLIEEIKKKSFSPSYWLFLWFVAIVGLLKITTTGNTTKSCIWQEIPEPKFISTLPKTKIPDHVHLHHSRGRWCGRKPQCDKNVTFILQKSCSTVLILYIFFVQQPSALATRTLRECNFGWFSSSCAATRECGKNNHQSWVLQGCALKHACIQKNTRFHRHVVFG